jgi:hypothetical protein
MGAIQPVKGTIGLASVPRRESLPGEHVIKPRGGVVGGRHICQSGIIVVVFGIARDDLPCSGVEGTHGSPGFLDNSSEEFQDTGGSAGVVVSDIEATVAGGITSREDHGVDFHKLGGAGGYDDISRDEP